MKPDFQNLKNSRIHLKTSDLWQKKCTLLEPTDKLEFVPLGGFEQNTEREKVFDQIGRKLKSGRNL